MGQAEQKKKKTSSIIPDFPNRRQNLRSQGQEGWRRFNATVVIQGNHYDPEASVAEARRAEAHVCTPDKIEINIFCDGSFGSDNTKMGVGGYDIAFKKNRPGQSDDQEEVLMAWKMDPAIASHVAEGLAVAQALVQAHQEVVATLKSFLSQQPMDASGDCRTIHKLDIDTKPIIVNIFSDSRTSLEPPSIRFHARSDDLDSKITRLSYDAADRLVQLQIPETGSEPRVKVQLQWLPSHRIGSEVRLHVLADRAASEARVRGSFLQMGSGEPQAIQGGLYAGLQDHFVTAMIGVQGRRKTSKREREDDDGTFIPHTKRPRRVIYNESDEVPPRAPRFGTKRRFAESSNPTNGENGRDTAMPLDERPKKTPRRVVPTLIRGLDLPAKINSTGEASGNSPPSNANLGQGENLPFFFDLGRASMVKTATSRCLAVNSADVSMSGAASGNAAPTNPKLGQAENLPFSFGLERGIVETTADTRPLYSASSDPPFAFGRGNTHPFSFGLGYTAGLTRPTTRGHNASGSRRRRRLVRKSSSERVSGPTAAEEIARLSLQQKAHDFFDSGSGSRSTTADASTQTSTEDYRASITASYKSESGPFVFGAGNTAATTRTPTDRFSDNPGLSAKRPGSGLRQRAAPYGYTKSIGPLSVRSVERTMSPTPRPVETRTSSPAHSVGSIMSLPILLKNRRTVGSSRGGDIGMDVEDNVGRHSPEEHSHFMMSSCR